MITFGRHARRALETRKSSDYTRIPGIGRLAFDSISRRDYPTIQGHILFVAVIYVFVNLLVDLLYKVFDPRIKYN